jgi:hypothetical protein
MTRHTWFGAAAALAIVFAAASVPAFTAEQSRSEEPETVLITLRAKAGSEAALARVIARHWETARELRLVRADAPHMTLKGSDGERTHFVEIMTWRDASVPDAAPAAIQAIWKEMNALVEARGGRPGLEIVQMTMVAPEYR